MTSADDFTVAYILKGFPRLSETFIANEICRLEDMGTRLRLFSIKAGDRGKVHEAVATIRAPLEYLPAMSSLSGTGLFTWLWQNLHLVAAEHLLLLLRRPLAYLATLAQALAMSVRYRSEATGRPRKVFIKEFLQAGSIAARLLDDAAVRHLHGHFCHGATTVTWFASRLTGISFSFTAHAKDIYVRHLNPGDLLEKKLRAASFVATCTHANERHLRTRLPDCDTVHTIYHGLDTSYFRPADESSGLDHAPLIISVGRLVEKKGFAFLIDACDQLRREGLWFRCAIIGERGDQFDATRRQIDQLGLADHVKLNDAVTQQELRQLYQQAALFALPCQVLKSGDRDGIPNVLAEAMASGLPVVSTTISGIPELVDDGVEGYLVAQRDSAALAAAIRALLEQPKLRQRMGENARRRICRSFDSRKTTIALHDLFTQTCRPARWAA